MHEIYRNILRISRRVDSFQLEELQKFSSILLGKEIGGGGLLAWGIGHIEVWGSDNTFLSTRLMQ